jgi:hypothetical protein
VPVFSIFPNLPQPRTMTLAPDIRDTRPPLHTLKHPPTHITNLNQPRPRPANMPPVTWTAERDQKLLLLLIEQINVTGGVAAVAAAAWKTKYGECSPLLSLSELTTDAT